MIEIRPFRSLGHANHGWLDAHHHFSFADYWNPERQHFGALRVWNDDQIRAGSGFPPHPHRDMEIITYVRKGAITHTDQLGNQGRTAAGDVQVMSAGTGIVHAEYNLEREPTEIFQIWVAPARKGLPPHWENRQFPPVTRDGTGTLQALASGRPEHVGAAPIVADATLFAGTLAPGQKVVHPLAPGRRAYLVSARGGLTVNGQVVEPRDGVAISAETSLELRAIDEAEILLLDLP